MITIIDNVQYGYQTYNLDSLYQGVSQMGWINEV